MKKLSTVELIKLGTDKPHLRPKIRLALAKIADRKTAGGGSESLNTHFMQYLADAGTQAIAQAGFKVMGDKTDKAMAALINCNVNGEFCVLRLWGDDFNTVGSRGQGALGPYTVWFQLEKHSDGDQIAGGAINIGGNDPAFKLANLLTREIKAGILSAELVAGPP